MLGVTLFTIQPWLSTPSSYAYLHYLARKGAKNTVDPRKAEILQIIKSRLETWLGSLTL